MSATIEFQLWGSIAVRAGGKLAELGATRQSCVLAVLLMSPGQTIDVERLVQAVWDGAPPARVHNVLATYASRLRRALASGGSSVGIRFISRGYRLECPSENVDVHRARVLAKQARKLAAAGGDEAAETHYAQALGLCTGVPLPGLRCEWAERTRRLLESERHSALMDRIDVELRLGRYETLVPQLSSLVHEYPADARLVESLMVALHRLGRRQEALAVYRDARRASIDTLGLEPGARLQRLERAILNDDPALEARP